MVPDVDVKQNTQLDVHTLVQAKHIIHVNYQCVNFVTGSVTFVNKGIVAAFRGMHVSPAT